jgi:hypothetical protein
MTVAITERQGQKEWPSDYQYLGSHNGLYAFVNPDTGRAEYFARRTSPNAGWHLVRGSYFYEFCSSMPN